MDDYAFVDFSPKAGRGMHPTIKSQVDPLPFQSPDILSPVVPIWREVVISNDQGSYSLLPTISGIREHGKYTTCCASWNYLNPPPLKLIMFVAQLVKQTRVTALTLVVRPRSIAGGVLHPGNHPKQLQTSHAVKRRWRPPPSRRLRRRPVPPRRS